MCRKLIHYHHCPNSKKIKMNFSMYFFFFNVLLIMNQVIIICFASQEKDIVFFLGRKECV